MLPDAEKIAYHIFRFNEDIGFNALPWPQLEKLITAAENLGSPGISKAVAKVRAEGPDFHLFKPNVTPYVPSPAANNTVIYRPLNLTVMDLDGSRLDEHSQIIDWRAAGKDVDVVVGRDDLYLMTQKDVLTRVFGSQEHAFDYSNICFDGKYIWAPVVQTDPLVLIIDPVSNSVTVAPGQVPGGGDPTQLYAGNGAIFWVNWNGGFSGELMQWGLPDFRVRTISAKIPGYGAVAFYNGNFHLISMRSQWIMAGDPAGPYVVLGG
jgi:hypothetical protein